MRRKGEGLKEHPWALGQKRGIVMLHVLVAARDCFSSVSSAQGPVNRGVDVFGQGPYGTIHHRAVQAFAVKTAKAEVFDCAAGIVIADHSPSQIKIRKGSGRCRLIIASTGATGIVVTPEPEQRFSEQQCLCGPVCDISKIDPAVLGEDPIELRIVWQPGC